MEAHDTDLYAILGVPHNATDQEIREAYRRIASETHPDKTRDDTTKTMAFRAATEAYRILGDATLRRIYDRGQVQPNSIQEYFERNPVALQVMRVQLPTAPAAPQRGVPLVASVRRPTGSMVVEAEIKRAGYDAPLKIGLQLPETDNRWSRLPNLGGAGRNGEENGDMWIFVCE